VVLVGGTGVGPDAKTVEAASTLFGKDLPGFGESLRRVAYEPSSTAAIADRTTAGLVGTVPVFCVPETPAVAEQASELVATAIEPLVEAAHAR
jgi:molybdenum cofactor biosynthesis protein B